MNIGQTVPPNFSSAEQNIGDKQNDAPDTVEDPFGSMLPSTEKLFSWALITLKLCLVIFAFLALVLEWRLSKNFLIF